MHARFRSPLSRSALAGGVSALGLFVALGAGPASAAVHSAAHGGATARSTALAFLKHLKVGDHATNHAVAFGSNAPKQVQSTNWSGYADYSATTKFSKVSGSWTEPKGTGCTATTSLAAFWVGIDGFKSGTVEQDGTLIECFQSKLHYFSWWELYPTNSIQVVGQTVKPGDKISASVVKSGTKYALKLTDSTTPANSFSKTATCAAATCVDSSAEWIAEAPSNSSGVLPLTNFGSWSLSKGAVTGGTKSGTISSFPDYEITMVNSSGSATKAKPGPLNSAGNAFKVTWVSST